MKMWLIMPLLLVAVSGFAADKDKAKPKSKPSSKHKYRNKYADSDFKKEVIDDNGNIGKIGQALLQNMNLQKGYMDTDKLSAYCPGYANLNDQLKQKAWLYFWRSLLMAENNVRGDGPPGGKPALYPFFLEDNDNFRRARGEFCKQGRAEVAQAACAVSIVGRQDKLEKGFYSSLWPKLTKNPHFPSTHNIFRQEMKAVSLCKSLTADSRTEAVQPAGSNDPKVIPEVEDTEKEEGD